MLFHDHPAYIHINPLSHDLRIHIVSIYIYICTHMHMYVIICIHILERERESFYIDACVAENSLETCPVMSRHVPSRLSGRRKCQCSQPRTPTSRRSSHSHPSHPVKGRWHQMDVGIGPEHVKLHLQNLWKKRDMSLKFETG